MSVSICIFSRLLNAKLYFLSALLCYWSTALQVYNAFITLFLYDLGFMQYNETFEQMPLACHRFTCLATREARKRNLPGLLVGLFALLSKERTPTQI